MSASQAEHAGSIPVTCSSSSQVIKHLRRVFLFHRQTRHGFLLLPPSQPRPLYRAPVWVGRKSQIGYLHNLFICFLYIMYIFSLVFFPAVRYNKDRIEEKEVLYSMSILNHVRALDVDDLIFGSEQKQTISDR